MTATELRIGNLVYDKWANVAKIESIGMHENVRISTKDYEFESNKIYDLFSINLTEYWLLKFGFTQMYKADNKNGYGLFLGENIHPFIAIELYHDGFIAINNGSRRIEYIKSVHQLQNLYFALTGKELEVKNG
jgi:hypothetical protein